MPFHNDSARRALPRLRPLAACLSSALLVHVGALAAATPGAVVPRGALSVQNCNDSGAGSLRDVVAGAVSGDIVDASSLACNGISLSGGAIVIGAGVTSLSVNGPGAAALTISGNDNSRVVEHQGTGTLSLSGLTLSHGRAVDNGGCVLADGNLSLSDVTVSNCAAGSAAIAGTSGGGAFVLGNATLSDTRFDGNTLDGNLRVRGGALSVGGTLTANDSRFTGNTAHSRTTSGGNPFGNIVEGGAIQAAGETRLTDSTVSGNTAMSDSYEVFGGGIAVGSHVDNATAPLDILRGTVNNNSVASNCDVCAPQGGGIAVVGIARLRQTLVIGNTVGSVGHYGGAGGMRVFGSPSVEIIGSTISGNHADSAGGGMIGPESGTVSLESSSVTNNFAGNAGGTDEGGGGILCFACTVQLSSSSVSGNVAESHGGGVSIRYGEKAPAPLSIINSTVSGNSADDGGGVFIDGGNAQISNSTIAFNTALSRGAGISATEYSYQIQLQSTIVSNNATAGDANNVWAFPDSVSGANNLIPNAAGLPASMPADTLTADPLLQPLAYNAGATLTHALGDGSPAIDAGNDAIGLVFDQRGEPFMREVGAAADIGALEQQPIPDEIFHSGFDENF